MRVVDAERCVAQGTKVRTGAESLVAELRWLGSAAISRLRKKFAGFGLS